MAAYPAPGNGSSAQGDDRIRSMQLEILRLESKLKDLHATDTVADQRALTTLRQHAVALHQESRGLREELKRLEVDPFGQRLLEEEMGALSATALASYIGDRVLKASRVLASSPTPLPPGAV